MNTLNKQVQALSDREATQYGHVAVLCGGISAERKISLNSGKSIYEALTAVGIQTSLVDVSENIVEELLRIKPDRVFIALHGVGGEDGKMQAILDGLNIPYTGSGVASSAIAMNKLQTKRIWQSAGINTPEYQVLDAQTHWDAVFERLGPHVFVKPACEGSSLGMSKVSSATALRDAYQTALKYDSWVIAEKGISGREFTVGIVAGIPLPIIELKTSQDFYNYEAKYQSNSTEYLCPCALNDEQREQLNQLAINAFNQLGCKGWGRLDVMMDEASRFYLLEVNTVPGMTNHSLIPKAAQAMDIDFENLCVLLLSQTFESLST